jgi:hypothetical protein
MFARIATALVHCIRIACFGQVRSKRRQQGSFPCWKFAFITFWVVVEECRKCNPVFFSLVEEGVSNFACHVGNLKC